MHWQEKLEAAKREDQSITRKTSPIPFDERMERMRNLMYGWVNYFKHAPIMGTTVTEERLRQRGIFHVWNIS